MKPRASFIDVAVRELRPGLFIQLDLSWIAHPFPSNRFMLKSMEQVSTLRSLGVTSVKVCSERSDPQALDQALGQVGRASAEAAPPPPAAAHAAAPDAAPADEISTHQAEQARHRELLAAQRASLAHSQQLHAKAVQGWTGVMRDIVQSPAQAAEAARQLSSQLVDEVQGATDPTIRVLSEAAGTGSVQHAINVTVLALMLTRRLGLPPEDLQDVALGALMHDIGRVLLPPALRQVAEADTALMQRERREHVSQGLRLGMTMGLPPAALRVIAQHHELVDGSGLPQGLGGEDISVAARVVAVVDRYDRLCNPVQGGAGRTPHEAQALLYAQMRGRLDATMLSGFIRLVGVYPPGSVVQLSDGRYAMVVSAHPLQPLKPCVLVHDAGVPREEALLIDLARASALGIRRSLHPQHLPRATLDYLAPGQRMHYYFAHELTAAPLEASA